MKILYDLQNIVELLGIKKSDVQLLVRLGIIPSLEGQPLRFDKREIDEWLARGEWEKHKDRYAERTRGKGLWI